MTLQKKGRGPLRVDYVPIGKVKPSKNNTRTHSPAQIDAIRKSIEAVGWTKPIIVDDKFEILAGHGAYMAAQQAGMTEVPIILRAGLTSAMRRAYRIADNKLAEKSEWDTGMLAAEFADLRRLGFDIGMTGFDSAEVDEMIMAMGDGAGSKDPDDMPALYEEVVTVRGDVWQCGAHKVICGDSTDSKTFETLMGAELADLLVTSPPYNVDIKYATHKDKGTKEAYIGFIKSVGRTFMPYIKGGRFVAWNIGVSPKTYPAHQVVALEDIGLSFYRQIVWEKSGVPYPTFQSSMRKKAARHYKPNYKHELIHLFEREMEVELEQGQCPLCDGDGHVPQIDANQKHIHETLNLLSVGEPEYGEKIVIAKGYEHDIWKINQSQATVDLKTVGMRSGGLEKKGKQSHCVKEHPAAFPVELPRAIMGFLTAPGEVVLDVFGGSGSTMIACEQKGRRSRLVEFDPQYVDLIVSRWQDYTGKQATHASEKKTFEAIAKARGKG